MSLGIENTHRSNHSIFFPQSCGSPFNDTAEHISNLGLRRLDFERCAAAGEVLYTVEGDLTPTSQQDEEARIATLAYALKKLGNPEDAAEFIRCLNAICEEGDARYRQVVASYYYKEIAGRGLTPAVRANQSGCLDQCEYGPTVVIYPQAIWYGRVTTDDVARIVEETILNQRVITELVIPDECLNSKGRVRWVTKRTNP